MKDWQGQEGDGDGDPKTAAYGLVTPGLTPISEHGDQTVQPFPGYEADVEDGRRRLSSAKQDSSALQGTDGRNESDERRQIGRSKSNSLTNGTPKLSPSQIHELVSSPQSLPIRAISSTDERDLSNGRGLAISAVEALHSGGLDDIEYIDPHSKTTVASKDILDLIDGPTTPEAMTAHPRLGQRSSSTPVFTKKRSTSKSSKTRPAPPPLKVDYVEDNHRKGSRGTPMLEGQPSPMPAVLPIPPLSLPTYLQLELSSDRPSALYIHRSATSDFPFESSQVKFERLLNFLFLPPNLEHVLWFGTIACLDAWLYTFTILPLRFLKAITVFSQWIAQNTTREVRDIGTFVYSGVGRVYQRRRLSTTASRKPSTTERSPKQPPVTEFSADASSKVNGHNSTVKSERRSRKTSAGFRHRRTRSTPSALLPNHKADILQGLLIISSCFILMRFDASRMYHSIRGQSAIKLYVIYNVLEVFDRLFSALGQDILECLFSKETLERNEHGRSKIIRPLWMFLLALVYNVVHAAALFYQVVTLNVAVNSYSNALLTLLMSNQFVEIKGAVFKKFEKENLFQLTCADAVERFQLWLMMLIIALRNIVEVGGLSISLNNAFSGTGSPTEGSAPNSTGIPFSGGIVIPKAFTLMPKWTGELLGPFLIVLGSEMLVDWCKHAYIAKFNNVKPSIYGRFLDVLAKDYYSHAFADQNLTKRLGLPVIPLSCLFIRAGMQTYHMLLATHLPLPVPSSSTSVSLDSETSPAAAALQHVDNLFRHALGRSSFGAGHESWFSFRWCSVDNITALATSVTFFLALYLVLLAFKLVLGMVLLSWARGRYKGMKEREHENTTTSGRRIGGWGVVEVNEDKRRWIYEDDPDALRELREKEDRGKWKSNTGDKLDGVHRYMMAAKRIW